MTRAEKGEDPCAFEEKREVRAIYNTQVKAMQKGHKQTNPSVDDVMSISLVFKLAPCKGWEDR